MQTPQQPPEVRFTEFFSKIPAVHWIGMRHIFFAISGFLVLGSLALILTRGLNYSIDFTGGNVVQVSYQTPMDLAGLRGDLEKAGFSDATPQHFTGTQSFSIRMKGAENATDAAGEHILAGLKAARPEAEFVLDKKEFVGPAVGQHLFKQAVFAVVFSLLGIIVYVAFRFANPVWGIAGVMALAHDVTSTFGLYALLQLEFDLTAVAVVLTIAGFSINDTIVIFDRLREKMRTMRSESFEAVANASINETLSRTIITSLTVFITVLSLLFLGGRTIHNFAVALTFGLVVGAYSTIAIALQIVHQWNLMQAGHPAHAHAHASEAPKKDAPPPPHGGRKSHRR
ncbi:MAG: protein-export membrane protein SecF [Elusimicrobia bacterium GWA2_69_24]|nr:MAG: protein-export membrane protein SecF [Elusimicrobia bacterium GWA2_69_24]HBL19112.1 protein translocase subunit SecF [Elusimicrobiota bacterium]